MLNEVLNVLVLRRLTGELGGAKKRERESKNIKLFYKFNENKLVMK